LADYYRPGKFGQRGAGSPGQTSSFRRSGVDGRFDCGPWQYDPYFTEWSQGGAGSSATRTAANVYNFSFWQYLDISYYFGHQVVIIPPTVWTNAAHANGVSSLGTLNLNDVNVSDYNVQLVAAQLIKIAQFYQFDGYLINDENGSGEQDANWDLQLMTLLRANQAKPLTVIWYDAPVSGGNANELNSEAVPFLQALLRRRQLRGL
jgi:endo-beta-N-acetylglucosaminidase D